MANQRRTEMGSRPRGTKRASQSSGALLALLLTLSAGSEAADSPGPLEPEERLIQATLDFQRTSTTPAGRLESYISLRKIWKTWQSVEPLQVEQALLLAANDSRKSPDIRDYARKLAAYARFRRGDLHSTQKTFRQSGYVTDWMVVGPFDNEGKGGFAQVFGPDENPEQPLVPGQAFTGKERPVRYRQLPNIFRYGWVDFGHVFRPSTHICAHATTFVSGSTRKDESKPRTITLWAGSNGAYRVAFNGQTVIEDTAYRGYDTGRDSTTVRLRPGQNRISVKVCGSESSPMFSLRIADKNGEPDNTLKITADIRASEQARENVNAAKGEQLPQHPRRLRGPLTLIKSISEKKSARAEELELAARYLVVTGGDDKTIHQARDLARRATEIESTVERELLLASLAEDRNAAKKSIEAAVKLADAGDIRVLLAQAHHNKTGPSPRDAFALYDRVLALDPNNLVALRGRVELYNRAGLKRTALATLERAYERRPHSVLLANMVASQRAALGLSTLAAEAEDRYSAKRFDDSSFLSNRLELSLSRRNREATLHWLARVKNSDPHQLWTHQVSARVHRALGNRKRALLDLETAHAIAPEDVGILQSLADLKGRMGKRDEQLAHLKDVLKLRPQEVEVRKYVDHIAPPEAPPDEKYAQTPEDFLRKRHAPAQGFPKRTLQDLTVSTVYENGLSSQFRQVVFQPLTDSAAASARQYAFQYQADRQRVQLKGARVYRADGSIDEAIESGEGAANDPSISMYTSARTYYVQFPRLEPGDVVELRYRVDDVTPRNEFADYYGDIVHMQSDEPLAHAEYVLVTPKSRKLYIDHKVPSVQETVKETKSQKIYRFEAENVPAITPETGMPPWSEVLGFVHVSTYESWDQLGKWYWGLVQEQLDLDNQTRKKLLDITSGKKTTLEKVKAVYAWVTKNTRYVALEFGIYGYKPRRCVQTVNRGWGDCKDKATVIVTFLRELGIDANLVVLRTGLRGDFRSKLPSLAPFDHAIAYVPELDLYLDGTAEHTGVNELPVMDQGALGLLILDGKAKLVRLPVGDPEKNVIKRDLKIHLDKTGGARLSLKVEVKGNSAPSYRRRYGTESNRRERMQSDLGSEFPGLKIDDTGIITSNLSDGESPVTVEIKGTAPQFARREGAALSIPVAIRTRLTPRFAALSSRTQDVRIQGFSTAQETISLTLPKGANIDAAPPESKHSSKFGDYGLIFKQAGRTVTVESHLSVKVDRVTPEEYGAFRRFCVEADKALSHRLLISP